MTVDIVPAKFHLCRSVADQRHPALAAMGVTGELEIKRFDCPKIVEEIGFVHE